MCGPGNFVTIPNQLVHIRGTLLHYCAIYGTDSDRSENTGEVEKDIAERLNNRAIDPHVVVSLATQLSSLITVIGETNNQISSPTGRIPA